MSGKGCAGPRGGVARWWLALAVVTVAGLAPTSASAQGMRGWATTTVQAVQLRPVAPDTIPQSLVSMDAAGNATYEGQPVMCMADSLCVGYRALPVATTVEATQDLSLTAWGLGMQGLSITTMLRGRAHNGSAFEWPMSDHPFDAILGYAQLVRGPWRVRAGRQEVRSGLGFAAFDGADAVYTRRNFDLEAYGGRSLSQALREPIDQALQGLEDFVPDESVILFGGEATARSATTSITARYQRQILASGAGLEAERGEVAITSLFGGARFTGSLDYDFGFGQWGKAHLTVAVPLDQGHWLLEATARHYVPYFSLNTIWGYFSPVAYDELQGRVSWSAASSFEVWATGGWRQYGNAGTTIVLAPLKDKGTTGGAGFTWQPGPEWTLQADYSLEDGPGGFLSSGDGSIRWRPFERFTLAATGTTFQQIEQYRLGDGRAFGGGLDLDLGITRRISLTGGVMLMRLHDRGGSVDSPWDQTRGWSALRIAIGSDPGMKEWRSR